MRTCTHCTKEILDVEPRVVYIGRPYEFYHPACHRTVIEALEFRLHQLKVNITHARSSDREELPPH